MALIYCYGIIENCIEIDNEGFESANISLIQFKDIFAIVSNVSEKNFSQKVIDKNIKDIKWFAKKGQIHEKIIGDVMKRVTVIPMKFCTIFNDKRSVETILEEKYADFKYDLNNLKYKIEMGVKVYFDSKSLKEEILEASSDIKKLEFEAEDKTPGIAYFEKQKIDSLLKEKLQERLSTERKDIFEKIKSLAINSKQNELLDKRLTKKDMLLNSVFLIKKSNMDGFKESVERIKSHFLGMEFQIWGPFPPYNFVK